MVDQTRGAELPHPYCGQFLERCSQAETSNEDYVQNCAVGRRGKPPEAKRPPAGSSEALAASMPQATLHYREHQRNAAKR